MTSVRVPGAASGGILVSEPPLLPLSRRSVGRLPRAGASLETDFTPDAAPRILLFRICRASSENARLSAKCVNTDFAANVLVC